MKYFKIESVFKINYGRFRVDLGFDFGINCGGFRETIFKVILGFSYKEATETRLNSILDVII